MSVLDATVIEAQEALQAQIGLEMLSVVLQKMIDLELLSEVRLRMIVLRELSIEIVEVVRESLSENDTKGENPESRIGNRAES